MFNWPGILASTGAILPAIAVLFLSYGRYDGMFRDNIVFLNLIGGMALGFLTGVFLLYSGSPLLFVIGAAVLVPLFATVVVNRRKWQGQRHAIFNAGALGAGAAATVTLLLWRDRVPTVAADPLLRLAAGGVAITLALTAATFLVGAGVLDKRPFRGFALGALAALPAAFFLEEFLNSNQALWGVLGVAYGGVVYAYTTRTVLPRGVSDEDRKRVRRFVLKRSREG